MNFQQQTEAILETLTGGERLLLHSCCGPCSSYVLEYLTRYFSVTLLYYNPCIHPAAEFEKRLAEQKRLLERAEFASSVELLVPEYDSASYFSAVKGLEHCPEGGDRCARCFEQRLDFTARTAKEGGFDYFATTLTVSPHKNPAVINAIGAQTAQAYGVRYLPSDFKKKGGYQRSLVLSKQYDLYRQNDCGCIFSKREACM